MRIDPFSSAASQLSSELTSQQVGTQQVGTQQVGSQQVGAQQVGAQAGTPSAASHQGVSEDDRTTLTSDTASLASLVTSALSSPEVRQGRVDNLRQAINNGEYQVDPASIAASMVGESS